ncbi:AMP-binding protein [Oxalobacteraceae bacterium]|nr:AMP-binding protein [Oxalobacteraceae bacterium]
MEKRWLEQYQPGVPAQIDINRYQSVARMLEDSYARFAGEIAFECAGEVLRYRDLDRLTRDFAAYLQGLGLRKGDRVAVMLPNMLQYPIAVFGVLRAGLVAVNVNPQYTPHELRHQLRDSGASVIVLLSPFMPVLEQVMAETAIRHVVLAGLDDIAAIQGGQAAAAAVAGVATLYGALRQGGELPCHAVDIGHDDIAFLQYTGGTTGQSKGAVLLHRNMVASMLQLEAWIAPAIALGKKCVMTPLPLYHIFPLANCLMYACQGGKNVLIQNPRDLPGLVAEFRRQRFDAFIGVNTLFNGLLATPGFEAIDFSALKLVLGAGASVQQAVAEKWQQLTGVALSEAYGLTETSPGVTITPLHTPAWSGSVGLPLPSTMVSLRNEAGQEVAAGEAGELCVSGPQVMPGYWQRPEENLHAFTADGYFRTGDIATMDGKGIIRIVDRIKDMILVSGFNVYPNEVEAAAALHPGILEAACIGVQDAKSGEAVKLYVVRRDGQLLEEEVRQHCKAYLTAYKVPKYVEFLDALPKSPVGKILRKQLRA